jgi:hypothetical protein
MVIHYGTFLQVWHEARMVRAQLAMCMKMYKVSDTLLHVTPLQLHRDTLHRYSQYSHSVGAHSAGEVCIRITNVHVTL